MSGGGGSVSWVAVAAFVLSLISLGWQVFSVYRRTPRLRVGLSRETYTVRHLIPDETDDHGEAIYESVTAVQFRVTVVNHGSEAATVYRAGLAAPGEYISIADHPNPMSYGKWGDKNVYWSGPELPAEIAANGVLEWRIYDPLPKRYSNELPWRGYAERYRAGKPPKTKTSKQAFARGL